jgi:uncharacterized membrane protein YfhO
MASLSELSHKDAANGFSGKHAKAHEWTAWQYYLVYTLLFVLCAGLVFAPFICKGLSLVWEKDGMYQHVIALMYLGNWLREIVFGVVSGKGLVIPLWDFSLGYGSDIATTLHYYAFGDPLNLLSVFVPDGGTECLYAALIVVRIYLAGLCFSLFCSKMGLGRVPTLAGALAYAFCGWVIFAGVRHPYFLNPLIYFPLLLLGFEKVFRKESPVLLMVAVFVSCISNFYFFYMLIIGTVIYALLRFFSTPCRHRLRAFGTLFARSCLYVTVGILMAAFVLLPVLAFFLDTDRSSTSVLYDPLFELDSYLRYILSFATPVVVENWSALGFSGPVILGVFVLFATRGNYPLKIIFIVAIAGLMLPAVGSFFNGFSYATHRWSWMIALIVCFVFAKVWPQLTQMRGRSYGIMVGMLLAYSAICLLVCQYGDVGNIDIIGPAVAFSLVLAFAAAALIPLAQRVSIRYSEPILSVLLIGLLVVGIAGNTFFKYDVQGYASAYVKRGDVHSLIYDDVSKDLAKLEKRDPGFSRYEYPGKGLYNNAAILGSHRTQYYWSLGSDSISKFFTQMGLSSRATAYGYSSVERRAFLDALLDVEFYAGRSGSEPYGFTLIEGDDDLSEGETRLFQNSNALPLGFTYEKAIAQSEYEAMLPQQRQEAVLQGIVLSDDFIEKSGVSRLAANAIDFTSVQVPYDLQYGKGVESADGLTFAVTKAGAEITLSFKGVGESETYCAFRGASFEPRPTGGMLSSHWGAQESKVELSAENGQNTTLKLVSPYYKWRTGQEDFLANVGYSEEPLSSMTIKFPVKGTYSFEDIAVVCQPMGQLPERVNLLREDYLTEEEFGANYVGGTIELDSPKILCLSIPYDKGWSAKVDGEPAEVLQANTMFSAIALDAGSHHVEFVYETYGLKLGQLCTVAGFALFMGIIVVRRLRSRR